MREIREAAIADATLEQLVCHHRDNAGAADRTTTAANVAYYASVQNVWADVYQELLDRHRAAKEVAHA